MGNFIIARSPDRGGIDDNSKISFLIFSTKIYIVTLD